MVYAYVVKLIIRQALRHHQAGDVDALLKFNAKDVRLISPGKNSWAGEFEGKELGPGCDGFIKQA